jgi:choline dehydrogenase-like flavoprotein
VNARAIPPRFAGDGPADWPRHTSQGNALAAALATGRTTLVTGAVAREVLIDADTARARAVAAVDAVSGASYDVSGRHVVLAASTLETTRLLLNSRSRQHGAGLGNSSGLLGRFLMDHPCTGIFGATPRLPALAAPPPQRGPEGIMIPRFQNLGRADRPYRGGFGIFGGVQRRIYDSKVFERGDAKLSFFAYGEMLPRPENRVTIAPGLVDRFGIPTLHIQCAWSDNERALVHDIEQTLLELFEVMGARVSSGPFRPPIPGTMVHEVGTARMGRDRRLSVVDSDHRLWDADNVLVVDGACWPSAGWQNPTLTMMALTMRACDRLASRGA